MLVLQGVLFGSNRLNEKITLISFIFFLALSFPMKILLIGIVWEVGIKETNTTFFHLKVV